MRENPNPKTCGSLCSFVEIDCHINLMHGMHVVFDIVLIVILLKFLLDYNIDYYIVLEIHLQAK